MVWAPISYATPGELMAVGIVLPLVATVVVATRFYARSKQHGTIGADDWLILLAMLLFWGMGAAVIDGVAQRVLGYDTPVVEYSTPEEALDGIVPQIVITAKIEYSFQLIMIVVYGLTKTSIIFFCRRIFLSAKRSLMDFASIALIVIIVCWTLGFLFDFAFGCHPISAEWGSAEDIIKACGSGGQGGEKALAISDLILDLIVITFPLPMVWRLHATVLRKIAVTAVFLLGAVAVAASIARMAIYLILFSEGSNPNRDRDQTISIIIYWSMIEAGLAIIAASLPSIWVLTRTKTPQQWLASIRSALALQSLSSASKSRPQAPAQFDKASETEAASTQEAGNNTEADEA